MGSGGFYHGSSSSSDYTSPYKEKNWELMSPEEKQQELERMKNAEQLANQHRKDERKRKAKKFGLITLGIIAGIGIFIGLIAILFKSCS